MPSILASKNRLLSTRFSRPLELPSRRDFDLYGKALSFYTRRTTVEFHLSRTENYVEKSVFDIVRENNARFTRFC